MFLVIDKSKIFSYIVAICTVIILFVAATGLNNMSSENSVMTSINITNVNQVNNINMINSIATNNSVNN